jgi:hypothetical protein
MRKILAKLALLMGISLALLMSGCCQATPEQVAMAQKQLKAINSFYDGLVQAKAAPNPEVYKVNGQAMDAAALATLALSGLDVAAPIFEALRQGYCVDNSQINQAVSATVGAAEIAPKVGVDAPGVETVPTGL